MNGAERGDAANLRAWLRGRIAELTGSSISQVGTDVPVQDHGLSSRDAVMVAGELEDLLDTDVPATLLWEHPTIDGIAAHLIASASQTPDPAPHSGAEGGGTQEPDPVAVVGLGCRLPGADGPERFWELLRSGGDAVGKVPDGRWEQFAGQTDEEREVLAGTSRWGGFLPDVAGFDAEFFGITPREAALMDPQQRVLLEVTWEALEHAGIPPERLRGSATGVYVGVSTQDYAQLTLSDPTAVDAWTSTGAAPSIAANRISYTLDLRGPSITLDTACSSSLVAVHQAWQSLRLGEVDAALVGGVNMLLSPTPTINFDLGGALAADGRCKAFDAAADGIVRGEGCGVLVLKRLSDAHRDGDRVLAVLRGSAINSDGRSNGLTAPSPTAQRDLLHAAYRVAGTDPGAVDYVEAHGTGTQLGDPIEASALGEVLGSGRDGDRPLLLGSVKTNLGHLEAAAGVAGLIKVVLAMRHGRIPPGLHYREPNPHIDFDAARLRVVTEATRWPRGGGVARAGVSGFGFGGTNAHVVLEEYTASRAGEQASSSDTDSGAGEPAVLALSARSPERLGAAAGELADWLETPHGSRADTRAVAGTLARRRSHRPTRAAVVADGSAALASALRSLEAGSTTPEVCTGRADSETAGPVWVFSGYGSQWPGMGSRLLATEPTFAARIDELDPLFTTHAGFSLRKAIEAAEPIEDLERTQLVIFGMQLGLASLWRSLGVEPTAVIGHSMGEVAAAVVAGGLGTEDGVRVMATRSRLLASLNAQGGGSMAAVELSAAELAGLSDDCPDVDVAVYGAPGQLTVAGDEEQIRAVVRHAEALGRGARVLPVRGAGHSAAVEPVLGELRTELADVAGSASAVPYYTSVLADPRAAVDFDAEYWAANARRPVRFEQAAAAALDDGYGVFLEIAPHPLLSGALVRTAAAGERQPPVVAASLRRGHDESWTVRANLGKLYCAGTAIAWDATYPGRELVDLPRTRWQHRHYWVSHRSRPARPAGAANESASSAEDQPSAMPDGEPWIHRLRAAEPAAARDMLGEHVREVLARVMGFHSEQLSEAEPLVELGLDSLMTVRIKNILEHDLEIGEIDVAQLRSATVCDVTAYLAGRLDLPAEPSSRAGAPPRQYVDTWPADSRSESAGHVSTYCETGRAEGPVRVLRDGGSVEPLFLFHPAGGSCDAYRPLVDNLSDRVPVYGFDRIEGDLPDRVAVYLRHLRELQPHGPYRLGGWSFGGALAYQAAGELVAAGEQVELVAMLDTMLPLPDPDTDPRASCARRFLRFGRYVAETYGSDLRLNFEELAALPDEEQIELVMARMSAAGSAMGPGALRHQRDSFVDTRAAERHSPSPFRGRVVLYRAGETDPVSAELEPRYQRGEPAAGWDEFCERLEVVPAGGTHLSMIDPPHITGIARHLEGVLGEQAGNRAASGAAR